MLEKLFPGGTADILALVLLGFATTDFIITMTLSAADVAAHFIHNHFPRPALQNQMGVTLVLLAILGAIFLKGFKEAIKIAVVLVAVYLVLNLVVSVVGIVHVLEQPHLLVDWKRVLHPTWQPAFHHRIVVPALSPPGPGLSGSQRPP